jgi:hypothetical protein
VGNNLLFANSTGNPWSASNFLANLDLSLFWPD